MPQRNRAEGWTWAKNSGHENEEKIELRLKTDLFFQSNFLKRLGLPERKIVNVSGGGSRESHVPSVFRSGELTKSKTDMYIKLDDGTSITFSVKKSLGGQVYLVTIDNFIEAYSYHYEHIPDNVQKGIRLYWGSDPDTLSLINRFGVHKEYEYRKHRLTAESIKCYDENILNALLGWFKSSAHNITELCFARGGARNSTDWAKYVWYKNELNENPIDKIFKVSDLCEAVQATANQNTFFGNRNGGSTIQLPFGFVQWHSPSKTYPGNLQFHHSFSNLTAITSPSR